MICWTKNYIRNNMENEIKQFIRENALYLLSVGYSMPRLTDKSLSFTASTKQYKGGVTIDFGVTPLAIYFASTNTTQYTHNATCIPNILFSVLGDGNKQIMPPFMED